MQAPDKGHDNGGKAVAGRNMRRELPQGTCHFQRPSKAGGTARNQQSRPERAARGETGKTCRCRRKAAYLLRNVPPEQRTAMLRAVGEQLAPGGVLALQDYTVTGSPRARWIWDVVCHLVVIPLAAVTLRDTRLFRYLWRSAREMEPVPAWCDRLREAGLEPLEVHRGQGWQRDILHTVIARRP